MNIIILSRPNRKNGSDRLLEAAKARGHEARIVDYTKCYCNIEKNNPQVYFEGKPIENVDAIIPRISINSQSYGSVVIRQFEMMNVFSSTGSLAFVRARDKLRSTQLLARHGIDIPKTAFVRGTEEVDNVIELVGGAPLIVKLARGSLGVGVVLAETRSAARAIIQAFNSQKVNILIQEFIKESAGVDMRVFVVDGEVVGAMKRTAEGEEFRSNVHLGGTTEVVTLTKKERSLAIRAAATMNLAIAGVDLLLSKRGPLVMEVNSFPMLEGIEAATGKDIASEIIAYLERSVPKKRRRDKVGA